jgi:hypothetical protein
MDTLVVLLLHPLSKKGGLFTNVYIYIYDICVNVVYVLLQEAGVHGSFTNIEEFSLALIPFDYDLMSMEMDNSFKVNTMHSHLITFLSNL